MIGNSIDDTWSDCRQVRKSPWKPADTITGWWNYWMVDEMEAAGHHPRLAHPLEAKKRMGKTGKKTDKLDANGLGILLRNGTLPEVWIPPPGLRDQRELLRLRMFLVQQRTRVKNRIQGALARYNREQQKPGGLSCKLLQNQDQRRRSAIQASRQQRRAIVFRGDSRLDTAPMPLESVG